MTIEPKCSPDFATEMEFDITLEIEQLFDLLNKLGKSIFLDRRKSSEYDK
jgi:hypothetical protein